MQPTTSTSSWARAKKTTVGPLEKAAKKVLKDTVEKPSKEATKEDGTGRGVDQGIFSELGILNTYKDLFGENEDEANQPTSIPSTPTRDSHPSSSLDLIQSLRVEREEEDEEILMRTKSTTRVEKVTPCMLWIRHNRRIEL